MAYVAVRGGEEAIEASLALIRTELALQGDGLEMATIAAALPELVDQVMGESSLYDPTLAALAIRQGGGSVEEAVFLLRAFRSTLERPYVSCVIDTSDMRIRRRVSAAFKDIVGGQILGASRDYSHRLLDFELDSVFESDSVPAPESTEESTGESTGTSTEDGSLSTTTRPLSTPSPASSPESRPTPAVGYDGLERVSAFLIRQGLLPAPEPDDTPPHDVTTEPLSFPAPRSVRLQTLARGMTQAVMSLGYAAIRGFGPAHPTVGELRQGAVAVHIAHPFEAGTKDDVYYVGFITVTEVESLFEVERPSGCGLEFGIGYGLVYGRAESKAIAMSVLDHCLSLGDTRFPVQDEEFVLYHVDGVEATGFISHLKLPHYVTFRSKLDSTRKTQSTTHRDAASQDKEAALQDKDTRAKDARKGAPHAPSL
jgi:alpha-D-ribose 1-methylphosphonate 5-triphosphate synthase subunit PhnI